MQKNPKCQINFSKKYLLINVSKNGSTSLRNTIKFEQFTEYTNECDDFYKFIVIRNPIYRAVSSYLEIIKLRPDGPKNITMGMDWFKEKDLSRSFNMFIEEIKDNFYDSHIIPQVNFLTDKGLNIDNMDSILLHDKISEDYNILTKSFNRFVFIRPNLADLQKGENNKKKLLTNIVNEDKTLQNKIKELYYNDNEIYNVYKNKNQNERFNRLHHNL